MATTTKNLGLVKPDYTDAADIAVINSNMDVLDEAVAGLQESIVTDDQLSQEVQQALQAAKDSGEFDGPKGEDGISPTVSTSKDGNVTTITIRDAEGIKTATVKDGQDGVPGDPGAPGSPGKDGVSPTVTTSKSGKVTTITIKDANGTKTATISDGADGKDGFSPVATVEQTDDGAIIRITDESGTTTASVTNGKDGENGYTPQKGKDYFDGAKGDPGYTPVKGVDYFDGAKGDPGVGIQSVVQTTTSSADGGSNVMTVTKTDGTSSTFTVKNGSKGTAGKTPVRGTDYWTDADKAEIKSYVDDAILGGAW